MILVVHPDSSVCAMLEHTGQVRAITPGTYVAGSVFDLIMVHPFPLGRFGQDWLDELHSHLSSPQAQLIHV